jgi:ribosomal-protein-alanine N-acetyltransferase
MQLDIGEYQIRSWWPNDEDTIVKYANNRKVWINMRDVFPHPYMEKDARDWIRFATQQNPETHFAIASAREAIGGIGLYLQEDVHRCSAEIGYWLGEPFWGKGIATRALCALTEYAFAHFDLMRIYATVFEWNPASARVLEKAGYLYEGRLRKSVMKDGKAIDQLLYALVRER